MASPVCEAASALGFGVCAPASDEVSAPVSEASSPSGAARTGSEVLVGSEVLAGSDVLASEAAIRAPSLVKRLAASVADEVQLR